MSKAKLSVARLDFKESGSLMVSLQMDFRWSWKDVF